MVWFGKPSSVVHCCSSDQRPCKSVFDHGTYRRVGPRAASLSLASVTCIVHDRVVWTYIATAVLRRRSGQRSSHKGRNGDKGLHIASRQDVLLQAESNRKLNGIVGTNAKEREQDPTIQPSGEPLRPAKRFSRPLIPSPPGHTANTTTAPNRSSIMHTKHLAMFDRDEADVTIHTPSAQHCHLSAVVQAVRRVMAVKCR